MDDKRLKMRKESVVASVMVLCIFMVYLGAESGPWPKLIPRNDGWAQMDQCLGIEGSSIPPRRLVDDYVRRENEPHTWLATDYLGARDAWARGFRGAGVKIAVIDTGVDFGLPDLQGTQAHVMDKGSPYDGWPIAFDPRSMSIYWREGKTEGTWYSNTSSTDTQDYVITGTSRSGIYHLGLHPDLNLVTFRYGERVGVLVVDEDEPGIYDTVYVDLNNNHDFTDDKPCRKGDEISWQDLDGDGLADISGGMVYFIADGKSPIPFSDVLHGGGAKIPSNGELIAFMGSLDLLADHGTRCASAIVAQGIVGETATEKRDGLTKGMAPDAKIIAIGNHYAGGNEYDSYLFAALGYDGKPDTGDEADVVSMSFGSSDIVNDGWDVEARFIDYLMTYTAPNTTFLAASGNGGHGYGTVTSPGSAPAVITVGGSTESWAHERSGFYTWGDVAPFSNRGPNSLGQVDPDVVSVGAFASGLLPLNQAGNATSSWEVWGGTSLSCPTAAGAVALIYDSYKQTHGEFPTSKMAKNILLSSADDLNYDPLVQGAGMVNASRACDLASGGNGVIVSPPIWNVGGYDGIEYEAFAAVMYPGTNVTKRFEVRNVNTTEETTVHIQDRVLTRTKNLTLEVQTNGSAEDGFQSNYPDYLLDLTDKLTEEVDLLSVKAYFPYEVFDVDGDYRYDQKYRLILYDWKDENGDGKYWSDSNGDGVVQVGEVDSDPINKNLEINRLTYSYGSGTTFEARVHDPLSRVHDGLLIGIISRPMDNGSDTTISVDVEFYTSRDWGMLRASPKILQIPANSTAVFTATLTIPPNAPIGLYEGTIVLCSDEHDSSLPVVVNVANDGVEINFSDNAPSDYLYDNGRTFGAFDWGWRYETGDWRFFFLNVPDDVELSPGKKMIVDVGWGADTTDIDCFVYGPMGPDPFISFWPKDYGPCPIKGNWTHERYGPYTMGEKGASVNTNVLGGLFEFKTATGRAEEMITANLTNGLNMVVLHNVLYAGESSSEVISLKTGTMTVEPYPIVIAKRADDSEGEIAISVTSDLDMVNLTAEAFGLSKPIAYEDQRIRQDDPNDPSTASWVKELDLLHAGYIKVATCSEDPIDIDLFLVYDKNGNGVVDFEDELMTSSTTPSSEESFSRTEPIDGKYWIYVHGWSVPQGVGTFRCDVTVIQGGDLSVGDVPLGNMKRGKEIEFDLSYSLPRSMGTWSGLVLVGPAKAPALYQLPVEVTIEPGVPVDLCIFTSQRIVASDGASTSVISVQLMDRYGNPVPEPGREISFSTTLGRLIPSPIILTDLDGRGKVVLVSPTDSGEATITASSHGIAQEMAMVEFTDGPLATIEGFAIHPGRVLEDGNAVLDAMVRFTNAGISETSYVVVVGGTDADGRGISGLAKADLGPKESATISIPLRTLRDAGEGGYMLRAVVYEHDDYPYRPLVISWEVMAYAD